MPDVAEELGQKPSPFGGWLTLMTRRLAQSPNFTIGIAMRSESKNYRRLEKDGITYYALPRQRDRFDVSQSDVEKVLTDFMPDILHVEGAEMRHARRFMETWGGARLLSMQGVLNGIRPYQLGYLPILRMLSPKRPRDSIVALALLINFRLKFIPRLIGERKAMKMADHVMGRTLWDQAQAALLAPQARYHRCSRILREEFYTYIRKPSEIEPFSLFIGNASVPLKGAHIAVQALGQLLSDFPQAILYIAGEDPDTLSWRSAKRYVGYPVYLLHLIRRLGLERNVRFTGILSGHAMADRMARSHVCLMSSIIENSPNTLGEAMILGVPIVSAYAGGAPSMASDESEALFYRAEDVAMMAFQIRRIFQDPSLAASLSVAARSRAHKTHDPDRNLADLIAAYDSIMPGTRDEAI